MNKKSKAGGILSIISGVFGIVWAILIFLNLYYAYLTGIVLTVGIVELLFGIICIIGGVFSIRARLWGLALGGAILGIFTFFPTGIAAIVLVSMGRRAFGVPSPEGVSLSPGQSSSPV